MRVTHRCVSLLCALSLACRGATGGPDLAPRDEVPTRTGLEGTVYRSPTRPVCQVDNPCRAPFSGDFEVRQGERLAARFQSDSAGHFVVHLARGSYRIVPAGKAGLLGRGQPQEVTVGPSGLTRVELDFDTGIR